MPEGWESYQIRDPEMFGGEMAGQQQQLAGMMLGAAQGQAPSAAQAMLQAQGAEQQARLRSALASAQASNRGLGFGARNAATQQQAAQAAGQMMSQQQAQMAQLRAQEMAQARAALGQQLGQMRQADIQGYGLGQGMEQLRVQQNRAELEAMLGDQAAAIQAGQASQQSDRDLALGIGSGIAQLGAAALPMLSDERVKTNVSDARDSNMTELLDALRAKRFDYRDSRDGGEDNTGIMAQDLERSEIGRTIVHEVDHPDGKRKALDMRRALAAALASSAHLHKRLKRLEGDEHAEL